MITYQKELEERGFLFMFNAYGFNGVPAFPVKKISSIEHFNQTHKSIVEFFKKLSINYIEQGLLNEDNFNKVIDDILVFLNGRNSQCITIKDGKSLEIEEHLIRALNASIEEFFLITKLAFNFKPFENQENLSLYLAQGQKILQIVYDKLKTFDNN